MTCDLSVIILTCDEEQNLAHAIEAVRDWAKDVLIFDSFSTDRTVDLARSYGCTVAQHRFENYGAQRNAALDRLPLRSEWVFFLDADEYPTEALKREITERLATNPPENGFYVNRRNIWMGKWVRRGYYPCWLLRIFRRGRGRCEMREVNEHLTVEGPLGYLRHDIIHEDHNGLDRWVQKHLRYADREAAASLAGPQAGELQAGLFGSQNERKRWLRHRVWERLPPLLRPILYFGYRYVLRGGFLDGPEGYSFHLLQGLWFQTIVDLKVLERRRTMDGGGPRRFPSPALQSSTAADAAGPPPTPGHSPPCGPDGR